MIGTFMEWLRSHLQRNGNYSHQEEDDLRRQVKEEHQRLRLRRARAQKVLADFHRADSVILGDRRGDS